MPDGETKVIYVELPTRLARESKADAARKGQSLREWYEAAARERLRQGEEQTEAG